MEKRTFRRASLALLLTGMVFAGEKTILHFVQLNNPNLPGLSWIFMFSGILCYALGVLIFHLCLRSLPRLPEGPRLRMTAAQFAGFHFTGRGLSIALSFVASLLMAIIAMLILGADALLGVASPLLPTAIARETWMNLFLACVMAPLVEEFMFRKQLLDVLRPFGDKTAILYTGIAFGLLHMTIAQNIFASFLGFFLAYVVVRTNDLRYGIALHFTFNASSMLVNLLLELQMGAPPSIGAVMAQAGVMIFILMAMLAEFIVGLVLLVKNVRRVRLDPPPFRFSRRITVGMILGSGATVPYIALSVVFSVVSLVWMFGG